MSKVLITGGAGFIGACTAEKLVSLGHEVISVDNFQEPYVDLKRFRAAQIEKVKGIRLVTGDINNTDFLRRLIRDEGIETVIHEAAKTGVRESLKNPFVYNQENIGGTLSVLHACMDSNVKRIINASATSVFGNPQYSPIDEKHPKNPISPYGLSKYAAEYYVQMYNQLYNLPTVVLRYFTVYGYRGRAENAITRFIVRAIHGYPIEIYGSGEQGRGFTFIDDIVAANVAAMERNSAVGHDLNIGGSESIRIIDLARKILQLTGSKSGIKHLEAKSGEIMQSLADTKKAERILGWKEKVNLEQGLKITHDWYKRNPDVYFKYCCEA